MTKKKMKPLVKILLIILVVIIGFVIYMSIGMHNMKQKFKNTTINDVNLKKVKDGTYTGSYKNFLVIVNLEVAVKNHKITDIKILKQECGKGYEGLDTIDRVKKAQSLKVDTVTGATGSSIAILKSIERALTGLEK